MTGDIRLIMADGPAQPDGPGTWLRVDGLSGDIALHVRCAWVEDAWLDAGRRLVITNVSVAGSGVNTSDLQAIPLGQIGRLLSLTGENFDVDEHGVLHLPDEVAPRIPLTRRREDESALDFSRRVAFVYRSYAARTGKPAKAIADDSALPVGTVRRWIREARDLGALDKGTRGRAG